MEHLLSLSVAFDCAKQNNIVDIATFECGQALLNFCRYTDLQSSGLLVMQEIYPIFWTRFRGFPAVRVLAVCERL